MWVLIGKVLSEGMRWDGVGAGLTNEDSVFSIKVEELCHLWFGFRFSEIIIIMMMMMMMIMIMMMMMMIMMERG